MGTNTVGIIQARMGSTRLPEKVLKDIAGKPMLARVVERVRHASLLDEVVVATSTEQQDDAIASFCETNDIPCYRGSESDVLRRYYEAAAEYDADTIVRVTSDCPLITPETIDRIVRVFRERDDDYVTNTLYYTYPDGLDTEVFSAEVIERAHEQAQTDEEREHVSPYIRDPSRFDLRNVENPVDLSRYSFTDEDTVLRWTVDYPADLEFVRAVFERLCADGEWTINQVAVLELLGREPELYTINDDRTHDDYHIETFSREA